MGIPVSRVGMRIGMNFQEWEEIGTLVSLKFLVRWSFSAVAILMLYLGSVLLGESLEGGFSSNCEELEDATM